MNVCHRFKALLVAATVVCLLAACGVETAGTAATAGTIKKNEIEQGRVLQEQAQQRADPMEQAAR